MFILPDDPRIRYTGRWFVTADGAGATANGSYLEFRFRGDTCQLHFRVDGCREPFPHVAIRVDEGAYVEAPISQRLRLTAEPGLHSVQLVLKSSVEFQSRWVEPIEARVTVSGLEAEGFAAPEPDNRPIIEFIGDSITEGVLVDGHDEWKPEDLIYMNDALAGYAWRTAKELDMRPVFMGYGRLGTTIEGHGGVPPVEHSYPYYWEGCPMPSANANIIVINHGTNDNRNGPERFRAAYASFLHSVRGRNPQAAIFCLSPFCGYLREEVPEVVHSHNQLHNDSIHHIDTSGWATPYPTHPLRDTCKQLSKRLAEEIRKTLIC